MQMRKSLQGQKSFLSLYRPIGRLFHELHTYIRPVKGYGIALKHNYVSIFNIELYWCNVFNTQNSLSRKVLDQKFIFYEAFCFGCILLLRNSLFVRIVIVLSLVNQAFIQSSCKLSERLLAHIYSANIFSIIKISSFDISKYIWLQVRILILIMLLCCFLLLLVGILLIFSYVSDTLLYRYYLMLYEKFKQILNRRLHFL